MNEREIQKLIKNYISNPAKIFFTSNNKRLQILSSGTINYEEGPDFKDIAILLNGDLLIGSAEFHFKSSDWNKHNHTNNDKYKNVILHIVIKNDLDIGIDTLVIDYNELLNLNNTQNIQNNDNLINSLEEIQQFSLLRLLRKSTEAQKLINQYGIYDGFKFFIKSFLERYNSKKRRPIYTSNNYYEIINKIPNSKIGVFLNNLYQNSNLIIQDEIANTLKEKIANEGPHLRREIIINCLLPFALVIANEENRISIFLWYWSIPSLHKYGILTRKFKDLPQNYLWQQQGMLEYLREYGQKENIVSDLIKENCIGNVLSFFQEGKSPYFTD